MKINYFMWLQIVLWSFLPTFSNDLPKPPNLIEGLSIENYPVTDGSDSTEPLRVILLCKLLGFDYVWERDIFLEFEDQDPKHVRFADEYYKNHSDVVNHLEYECLLKSNTHPSFQNLIEGKVDLIITARSMSYDEKIQAQQLGVSLIEQPIAKDALTFIINPNNPTQGLTHSQLQDIYLNRVTRWNEIGEWEMPITPYIRNRNSGSQEKFESMVMQGLELPDWPELRIGNVMSAPYVQIEEDETGIAFTPFYYFRYIVDNDYTKPLNINGVAMTKGNIENGSYPFTTEVFAAVRSDINISSMAYKIFEFLTTTNGQDIIAESGYVPLFPTNSVETKETPKPFIIYDRKFILSNEYTFSLIDVYDTQGKCVISEKSPKGIVNIELLENGIYFIILTDINGKKYSEKVSLR